MHTLPLLVLQQITFSSTETPEMCATSSQHSICRNKLNVERIHLVHFGIHLIQLCYGSERTLCYDMAKDSLIFFWKRTDEKYLLLKTKECLRLG